MCRARNKSLPADVAPLLAPVVWQVAAVVRGPEVE
jgi:hypothetical protein